MAAKKTNTTFNGIVSFLLTAMMLMCISVTAFAADYSVQKINEDGTIYSVTEGSETYTIYCHDQELHAPPAGGQSAEKTIFTDNTFDDAALKKKILATLYVGYPADAAGFSTAYPTTEDTDEYKILATQGNLWLVMQGKSVETSAWSERKYYFSNDFMNNKNYYDAISSYVENGGGYGLGALTLPFGANIQPR